MKGFRVKQIKRKKNNERNILNELTFVNYY